MHEAATPGCVRVRQILGCRDSTRRAAHSEIVGQHSSRGEWHNGTRPLARFHARGALPRQACAREKADPVMIRVLADRVRRGLFWWHTSCDGRLWERRGSGLGALAMHLDIARLFRMCPGNTGGHVLSWQRLRSGGAEGRSHDAEDSQEAGAGAGARRCLHDLIGAGGVRDAVSESEHSALRQCTLHGIFRQPRREREREGERERGRAVAHSI
eukprot:6176767-Pleurochrysis_carterae.AAC.1